MLCQGQGHGLSFSQTRLITHPERTPACGEHAHRSEKQGAGRRPALEAKAKCSSPQAERTISEPLWSVQGVRWQMHPLFGTDNWEIQLKANQSISYVRSGQRRKTSHVENSCGLKQLPSHLKTKGQLLSIGPRQPTAPLLLPQSNTEDSPSSRVSPQT